MKLLPTTAGIVALLYRAPPVAGSACMTVTQDTVLDNDFSCYCSNNGSAIEVQQATLDLNGFRVSCANGYDRDTFLVRLAGKGAKLLNGTVLGQVNSKGGCVAIEDSHQTIAGVMVEYCETGIAVLENANFANITANRIRACGSGILSKPFGPILISGNDVRNCRDGIYLTGMVHNATVVDNYVAEIERSCIKASACSGVFEKNKVIDCHEDGIAILEYSDIYTYRPSNNNQIKKNAVSWCGGYGLRIRTGDHNLASDNFIEGAGFFIFGDGNLIKRNRLYDARRQDIAIEVRGNDIVVETNAVSDAGGTCMAINGRNTTVRHNDLKYCGGDGIAIDEHLNSVTSNFVKNCGNDGIVITFGYHNFIGRNKVESVGGVAFHDHWKDCGTKQWKQNEGSSFKPSCTGNHVSYPRPLHNHSVSRNTVV